MRPSTVNNKKYTYGSELKLYRRYSTASLVFWVDFRHILIWSNGLSKDDRNLKFFPLGRFAIISRRNSSTSRTKILCNLKLIVRKYLSAPLFTTPLSLSGRYSREPYTTPIQLSSAPNLSCSSASADTTDIDYSTIPRYLNRRLQLFKSAPKGL